MPKPQHALDFLAAEPPHDVPAVCAAFGDEPFLKRQVLARLRKAVLADDEADFSLSEFDGSSAELRDVHKDLATRAMFGAGRRMVVVDSADEFVTRFREPLEDYVSRPVSTGVLVLMLDSFPSNTRLHKAVTASGLLVDCSAPPTARLTRWLAEWGKQTHAITVPGSAAELLVDLIGPELGLLDQELAKLALVAGAGGKVTVDMVQQMAGAWRAKTTWAMLDAALAGNVPGALGQLDRLLAAGETPIGILGQISANLRRFAAATRLVVATEKQGRRPVLRDLLEQAGVRSFVLQKTEQELRRLGRQRGAQLYRWLLQADMDLKGDSQLPARLILERLIVRLAAAEAQLRPAAAPS